MKCQYLRIEDFTLLNLGITVSDWVWIDQLADVERREDYCAFFVKPNSASHTVIVLKFGDIFT